MKNGSVCKRMLSTVLIFMFSFLFNSWAGAQLVNHDLSIDQTVFQPQRIVVSDDGTIYVSEPRQDRVCALTGEGDLIAEYMIDGPLAVGLDYNGLLLVGHETRVDAYQSDGQESYTLGVGDGEFDKPNDMAVAPGGTIYVTDSPRHMVRVYAPDGTSLFTFGEQGTDEGEFMFPTGIAIDSESGELYVADQGNARVQVFDLQGNYLRCFGEYTYELENQWVFEGTFTRIQGLGIDPAGRVYVSDCYQNNVQILSGTGEFLGFISNDEQDHQYFSLPMDVAVRGNQLYVTSTAGSSIEVFSLEDITPVIGSDPPGMTDQYELAQNFPNPFNPNTCIRYTLPQRGHAELTVLNIVGREVARLVNADQNAGTYEAFWNGRSADGNIVASGIYFYTLKVRNLSGTPVYSENRMMLFLK